jgi:hypothetical protein
MKSAKSPCGIGGGEPNLCEPEPVTSKVTVAALWKREEIDPADLARLRWVENWPSRRLAEHFGVGRSTVKDLLRKIAH